MDPYKAGLFTQSPYYSKTTVEGRLTAILQVQSDKRGLNLISQKSRCLKKYDIHELVATDEDVKSGDVANRAAYLAFVEIETGGVVIEGDELYCAEKLIGTIAGFDETHMPNHINIVVKTANWQTGAEMGLTLESKLRVVHMKA